MLSPKDVSLGKRPERIIPRAHYNRRGQPYTARFIDGFEHESYPDAEDEIQWLIEGGFTPGKEDYHD